MTTSIFFLGSLICLTFSFFIISKDKNTINKSFFLYSLCLGIWLLSWTVTFLNKFDTLMMTRLIVLPAYFLPITFNMFSNGFRNHKLLSKYELYFHIPMLCLFLGTWHTDLNIISAEIVEGHLLFTFGSLYSFFGLYLLAGMGIGIFNLLSQLKNSHYQKQQQLKHTILGTFLGTLNGLVFSFVFPFLGYSLLSKFSTLSSLWIVGFSFYAITKHKLMNINILISKTFSYIITSVLFLFFFSLAGYIKHEYFKSLNLSTYTIIFVSMISGVVFLKLRKLIQNTSPLHLLERYNLAYFSKDILELYVDCFDLNGFTLSTKKFFVNKLGIRQCSIFVNTTFLEKNTSSKLILKNISNLNEKITDLSLFSKSLNFVSSFNEIENPEIKFYIEKYKTELVFSVFKKDTLILSIFLDKSNNLNLKSIDPEVFEALASQINIVLDRIKPFEKVKNEFSEAKNQQIKQLREKSVLETEYNIAKTIQERFLPKEIVSIPGFEFEYLYQPSRFVGGDYFDIHSEGKHKMGFLICDVVGKGLESSFTTIQLHSIFHSKVSPKDSPKEVLSKLNDSIYQLRTQKNHCTAFYLELNPVTRVIKYADAGNGLSYLVRQGKLVSLNDYGGMVLGACHDSTYTEGEIKLQEDDLLFLSTDGLLDFKNNNRERFGVARMESLIESVANKKNKKDFILDKVNQFKGPLGSFQDDITLFTASVKNYSKRVSTLHEEKVLVKN